MTSSAQNLVSNCVFIFQENKVRITLLMRKTKYRQILNEDEVGCPLMKVFRNVIVIWYIL